MKKTFQTFFLVLMASSMLLAQKPLTFKNVKEALAAGRNLSGGSGPQSVNWIQNGNAFSFIDKEGKILSYTPATGKETLIFSAEGKKFPNSEKTFEYESFQWSADFNYLLFQTNFRSVWRYSGDADYYLYSIEKQELTLVAKDARTAELSPDGKKVGFERGGNLFVLDLATRNEIQLTNDAQEAVYNGRFGWAYEEEFGLVQAWVWSPDSKYIAFWRSDESQVPFYQLSDFQDAHPKFDKIPYPRVGDPNIQVKVGIIDLAKITQVSWMDVPLNDGYIPRIYWTARSGQLAMIHLNRKQNEMTLYFGGAGMAATRKVMQEKDEDGWVDVYDFFANTNDFMVFPKTKEEFYWISGRDGFQHIYRFDYKGTMLNKLTSGAWDVTSIAGINEAENLVYYTSTEVSPLERHLYVVATSGANKSRLTIENGRHNVNVSTQGQYFIDTYSNLTTPRQIILKNAKGITVKALETNEAVKEYVEKNTYSTRDLLQFTASDGQKIDIYLVKPVDFDASKKYPLVLTIYGGPGSQSVYNQWNSSSWEQCLAQNGYVVASVNNRGSGGYGQQFMESVYKKLGQNESKDFIEAADYLGKSYSWIDRTKCAIQGHSYGGFMSSYTMLIHPKAFKVGIVGAPVTNWKLYDNIYTERYMGVLPENEADYQKTILSNVAGNLEGNVLLAHSMMDDNVHIINTMQLVKSLLDAGKDIDLRIYPPGNHGVAYNFESSVVLYQTYLNFLNNHLK